MRQENIRKLLLKKKTLLSCAFESENQISNFAYCHAQKRKGCNIDAIKSSKPFSKFQHMY